MCVWNVPREDAGLISRGPLLISPVTHDTAANARTDREEIKGIVEQHDAQLFAPTFLHLFLSYGGRRHDSLLFALIIGRL